MEKNECDQEVDDLEKEAKFTIISMEDNDGEEEKQKILEDAKEQITQLYYEFRQWLQDTVSKEDVNARLKRLNADTTALLQKTKERLKQWHEREDIAATRAKAIKLGNKVVDSVNDGISDVMKNEHVTKAMDSFGSVVDNVRSDERVKSGVKRIKKGTLKAAESAFNGLKRVLDTEDDQNHDQKG